MLSTRIMGPDGRLTIMLGLSMDNYRLLHPGADSPLRVDGRELGLAFDVVIFTGKDERTMLAQVRDAGASIGTVRMGDPAPPPTAPEPAKAGVDHGSLPEDAMRAALERAYHALEEFGIHNPAITLIVQDDDQRRGLASTIANPADLLRVVLFNLESKGIGGG